MKRKLFVAAGEPNGAKDFTGLLREPTPWPEKSSNPTARAQRCGHHSLVEAGEI
jgi:hypothetical protein